MHRIVGIPYVIPNYGLQGFKLSHHKQVDTSPEKQRGMRESSYHDSPYSVSLHTGYYLLPWRRKTITTKTALNLGDGLQPLKVNKNRLKWLGWPVYTGYQTAISSPQSV
jgi:hypothetical protein